MELDELFFDDGPYQYLVNDVGGTDDFSSRQVEPSFNGAQLGWLIDPGEKTVSIYRPDGDVVTQIDPETLSGDPLLPGFILNLRDLWR